MTDDLISRQAAITLPVMPKEHREYQTFNLDDAYEQGWNDLQKCIELLPLAQPDQRWIPVKTRPMTEEERQYYSEMYGYDVEYEEAVMFDCKMPEDEQEIWVCSKCGNVWEDTCVVDEGIGLEGNGDWLDIVAWMPRIKPEPWKGEYNG